MKKARNTEVLVSIVVRTKNEERWIAQCLEGIIGQDYRNFEVIIVDNESSDKTIEKIGQFRPQFGKSLKVVTCGEYKPGKALNIGIENSRGVLIACLSGHCIPVNGKWLSSLVRNFDAPSTAGVYGRQEPMAFTSDADKRDLALVFGLDRKVQKKDSFFHNANSMIRRKTWDDNRFDEEVTNIEDRLWAKVVQEKGFEIVYEPEASVYHYHGIHQNGDVERCTNVVRILESMHNDYAYKAIDITKLNIIALIPVRGAVRRLNNKPLLAYTIEAARQSKYIKKTVVSTDNPDTANLARELGAEAPFMRDASLSGSHVNLAEVLCYSLKKIEGFGIFPDVVVSLEITFPFRPKGIIDDMIEHLSQKGLDSVIAARRENKAIWKERNGVILQLDEGLTPRQFKEPTFIELKGIACVTHPEFIRHGRLLGEKTGIYELNDPYSHLEVRDERDFEMASLLFKGRS